jgi:hypothetical protein
MTQPEPHAAGIPAFLEDWSFAPAPMDDAFSFSVGDVLPEQPVPTFRMDLPAGDAASAALDSAEKRLLQSEAALESVPEKLDALLRAVSSGTVSYAVSGSAGAADLLQLLERAGAPDATSFGLFSGAQDKMEDTSRALQEVLQRLTDMVSRMANVETSVQGRQIGRTRIGWSGSFETLFPLALSTAELQLHQRSIHLALASRRLAVSMIARTAQSAVKVSALLATPGGALLALPAVWKYINGIINEVKIYQQSKASS